MLPLYREEALRHAAGRLDGEVLLPSPVSTWLIGGVLVGALALGAWFAATASYARSETVTGWLVPSGDELVAELFVPSHAAGFINAGQTLKLKYEAFPFQRFGSQEATVDNVSLTVLTTEETGLPGAAFSEPVFSARGRLAAQTVYAYGTSVPLRAGMLLSADVVVDRRTLVEWLLDPVYAAGRR